MGHCSFVNERCSSHSCVSSIGGRDEFVGGGPSKSWRERALECLQEKPLAHLEERVLTEY